MDFKQEWKKILIFAAIFAGCFYMPVGYGRFDNSIAEALYLLKWYAREHVVLCLVPAFFIAGAIGVFISQASVMKYLGAGAGKVVAYGVASVSGSVLAVCSCTVLPLFAGIWRMGAGLGPACAFLYSGPAINVLAIILTARILGLELGVARAVGAVVFSIVIGLLMHVIYRKEEHEKVAQQAQMPEPEVKRSLGQNAVFFAVMVAILVFSNWGKPGEYKFELKNNRVIEGAILVQPEGNSEEGIYRIKILSGQNVGEEIEITQDSIVAKDPVKDTWFSIWKNKWLIAVFFMLIFAVVLIVWFSVKWWMLLLIGVLPALFVLIFPLEGLWILLPFIVGIIGFGVVLAKANDESREWFDSSWGFAKQIMPLLFAGVLVAGFLLGRPGGEGMIPSRYIKMLVGDSPETFFSVVGITEGSLCSFIKTIWPVWTNLFASIFGAFMYFATLTEVPILQGLIGSGMGKGPALALLLAGPALSLPNMLVIRSIMGTRKTVIFVSLVVVMATLSGLIFGYFV